MKYAPEQNSGTQHADYLCRCNNCNTILIDENPQTDAPKFELTGNEENMEKVREGEQIFWACPRCKTDEYLMDFQDIPTKN